MKMGLTNPVSAHFARHDPHKIICGILIAPFSFAAMGTVTAVWRNPVFSRMTPIKGGEFASLLIVESLAEVVAATRPPGCSAKKPGSAVSRRPPGIASPTCNKVLMFIFGGEALMRRFDPVPYWGNLWGADHRSLLLRGLFAHSNSTLR